MVSLCNVVPAHVFTQKQELRENKKKNLREVLSKKIIKQPWGMPTEVNTQNYKQTVVYAHLKKNSLVFN